MNRTILVAVGILVPALAHAQSPITPGAGSITDTSGNAWVISASGSIQKNGGYVAGGGGTSAIVITGGTVYGEDAHGRGWFALSSEGQYWTSAPTPLGIASTVLPAPTSAVATSPSTSTPVSTPPTAPSADAVCTSIPAVQTILPCGMFHASGSQIVDQQNRPVRLNCTAWWGDSPNPSQSMLTAITAGFNCFRMSWYNASIDADMAAIDQAIAVAGPLGIRLILNNHANEGGGNCAAQQVNGIWYDSGPGTDGTDGCGAQGKVTQAKFLADWQRVAQHYAGNQTVIGYDLWNEPLEAPNGTAPGGGSTWGDGGLHDLRAMYQNTGNALLAISPSILIICEGPITWAPIYDFDLTHVTGQPVKLSAPNQLVYSVHNYPKEIGGQPIDSGQAAIDGWNAAWGYVVTQNIAPVWVGEIGASMNSADASAWAATIGPYLNGKTPGGIVIPTGGQGLGTDWWMWSSQSGGLPNGALQEDKLTPKAEQAAVYSQWVQSPIGGAVAGTPAPTSAAYGQVVSAIAATAFPATATQPAASSDATQSQTAPPTPVTAVDQQATDVDAQIAAIQAQIAAMQATTPAPSLRAVGDAP